jgi:hypothetical protein
MLAARVLRKYLVARSLQGHKNWLCDLSSLNDRVGVAAASATARSAIRSMEAKRCGSKLVPVESRYADWDAGPPGPG